MMRYIHTAVFVLYLLTAALSAQDLSREDFRKMWGQGITLEDDKLLDKAMNRGHLHAVLYFEEFCYQARNGTSDNAELNAKALMASWERCFKNKTTLEHVQGWVDLCDDATWVQLQKVRSNSSRVWSDYVKNVATGLVKKDYASCYEDFITLARAAETVGHYHEAGELWGMASVIADKMPEKTIEDREGVVFAIEQQLACRDRWGYTFDGHYIRNKEYVASERTKIAEAKKDTAKRAAEGYDANAKGVESLIMPKAEAKKFPLSFEALKDWQADADYGPRGGPVPSYWWLDSLGEDGTSKRMSWFRSRELYLLRRGASKYAVSWLPTDDKDALAIDVSPKAKPSTFYLGPDKTLPYAMFFWIGTDAEPTGVAKCNYSATDKIANVYYRSASSWKTQIDTEPAVFYDDDASGKPGEGEPFKGEFKSHILGNAAGDGVPAPLFDSMKIGKGKRVPYSQFVKLAAGWHYMEIASGADVAVRPLNPEYVKSGMVKLNWAGAKVTAPRQLVIQGRGDYATAIFDIAGGKPVEVPAGEYSVVWGRILSGKSPRAQTAQIYPTDETKPFLVKAGETFELDMGADSSGAFLLDFQREGDRNASVSALTINVKEKSGCKITAMHGIGIECEVVASKDASAKGAKPIGEFVPFENDMLIGEAAKQYNNLGFMTATFPMPKGYKSGEMVLTFKLPDDGMKIGLVVKKKHKFFGALETVWK